jgi:hypothetical protein
MRGESSRYIGKGLEENIWQIPSSMHDEVTDLIVKLPQSLGIKMKSLT